MINNCIEIEFYDLPLSTRNRLGVNSVLLDITDNEAIRLTKNVEALTNANKLQTDGAQPFSAPSNPTNDAIFAEFITPNVVDNRREYFEVRVRIAGHPLTFTRLAVTGIPKTQGGEWSLELRRAPDHWLELAGTKFVNTINFGMFELTKANVLSNWEVSKWKNEPGDVPYIWPVMDYGNWCDRSLPVNESQVTQYKSVALEDLRPLVSLPYLLKQGFCEIGWTLDGLIFDTDFIAGWYAYLLNEEYYKAGSVISMSVLQTVDREIQSAFLPQLMFNVPDFSNMTGLSAFIGTTEHFLGIKNELEIAYNYTFEFSGRMENTSLGDVEVSFDIRNIDYPSISPTPTDIISEEVLFSFAGSEVKDVYISITTTLQPGQRAAMCMPQSGLAIMKAGSRGKVYPDDKSFYTGQTIDIKKAVESENTLLTYFKAFCHLTRSRVKTDEVTKNVTLYPRTNVNVLGEGVAGFMLDEQTSIDISGMVVQGSEQLKAVRPDQTRFIEVGFKDSTDNYIKSLKLTKEPYRRKVLNSNLLPDEVTEIYNPVFEPTLEYRDNLLNDGFDVFGGLIELGASVVLPRMWDNDNRERSFRIAPRLFYSYGKIKQKNPNTTNFLSDYASFFFCKKPNPSNTDIIQEFGYASMLPTRILEPTPDFYGNLVFDKQVYGLQFKPNSDSDLFNTFYLNITNELRGGFEVDLLMSMNMNFFKSIDFRRYFKFMYRGRPITAQMTQIRDFVGCSGIATPATFFIEPTESECCTLPCGCQFSTCEYYQDFGPFITQSTLDGLSITKFEVDGVSAISGPVGFGVINIINILGRPFVSNLVDTLNAIGAPYMAFDYAYRLDALKGARFFTIKKPVCQGFTIEISNSTEVLYRYTESVQEQTWFGAGFTPFSYGANSYGEPENCQITTEY